jgi:hypothetical protein
MQSIDIEDFHEELPGRLAVSVIMEKRPSSNPWLDFTYQAVGVVAGQGADGDGVRLIHEQDGVERHQFSGLVLQLYADQSESYYHNLMSPRPGCFIVAEQGDDANVMPRPYLVSLSFDEVHAYLEGDAQVYAVDIPPELYKWSEAYVLTHYVAEKKKKRKLTDWRQQASGLVLHSDSGVS